MITDHNRTYDGWISLEGGVDAGRAPNMINPNQCANAINMTFRGGSSSTRPGFRQIDEQFRSIGDPHHVFTPDNQVWCYNRIYNVAPFSRIAGEYADNPAFEVVPIPPNNDIPPEFVNENSEYIYRNGNMQCAIAYSPPNGEDCIMALVGGRLFKIVPGVDEAKVTEIVINDSPKKLRNMQRSSIAYMEQADKWMIAQDGNASAIIYDGAMARRSDTVSDASNPQIPVGTIMAYGMGRICVVVNDRDVAFGDLFGSHDLPDPADSLILFTERTFLAEGFDSAIPFQFGEATGAVFFPQLDTSTGNGQLMVFAERGASSFFLSLDRTLWKTTPGFQTLSLVTTGLRGHRSIAVVNEDLWFRADDGVRSFRQARSEQTGWAHIPLSTNVRQYMGNDSDWLLKYASAIYFDNRVIFTVSPMWNNGRILHWGLVAVDFDILSSFGSKFSPAWEGAWQIQYSDEFVFPTQLLTGTFNGSTRAFMFGINASNQNQLYELSRDDRDDFGDRKINWQFESRTLDFMKMTQNPTPFTENELYDGDIWLKEIED